MPLGTIHYTVAKSHLHYTIAEAENVTSSRTIPDVGSKTESEVRLASVDFQGKLESGEALTGTVTVTDDSGTLTLANAAVNSAALVVNGKDVAVGQGAIFKITGGTAGNTYTVKISVATDGTPAQTLNARIKLRVIAD